MPRLPRLCEDEAAILEAINAYLPAYHRHSWALSRHLGIGEGGSYIRIGRLSVRQKFWKEIVAKHAIVMAEHFVESRRARGGARDFRLIKSRFGEKTVKRLYGGRVSWTDNKEAETFYNERNAEAVIAITDHIHAGSLDEAIAEKKRQKAQGFA